MSVVSIGFFFSLYWIHPLFLLPLILSCSPLWPSFRVFWTWSSVVVCWTLRSQSPQVYFYWCQVVCLTLWYVANVNAVTLCSIRLVQFTQNVCGSSHFQTSRSVSLQWHWLLVKCILFESRNHFCTKLSAYYRNRMFFITFLYEMNFVQTHTLSFTYIRILFYHSQPDLPSCFLPWGFPAESLYFAKAYLVFWSLFLLYLSNCNTE
jgi:hypothetical protein